MPDTERRENRTLDQITRISRLLETEAGAIVHDYTVSGDPGISETATLSYSLPLSEEETAQARLRIAGVPGPGPDATVWKITLQTSKVARLAETMRISRDDEHAIELARLDAETRRLREDPGIRTRDFQDALAISTQIEAERDEARAARARLAELGEAAAAKED